MIPIFTITASIVVTSQAIAIKKCPGCISGIESAFTETAFTLGIDPFEIHGTSVGHWPRVGKLKAALARLKYGQLLSARGSTKGLGKSEKLARIPAYASLVIKF